MRVQVGGEEGAREKELRETKKAKEDAKDAPSLALSEGENELWTGDSRCRVSPGNVSERGFAMALYRRLSDRCSRLPNLGEADAACLLVLRSGAPRACDSQVMEKAHALVEDRFRRPPACARDDCMLKDSRKCHAGILLQYNCILNWNNSLRDTWALLFGSVQLERLWTMEQDLVTTR